MSIAHIWINILETIVPVIPSLVYQQKRGVLGVPHARHVLSPTHFPRLLDISLISL